MSRRRSLTVTLAILAVVATLEGCPGPTSDAHKLRAIKAEAEALMTSLPDNPPRDKFGGIPKSHWPPAIASLQPHSVTHRVEAHRFYFRQRYVIGAFHFYKLVADRR